MAGRNDQAPRFKIRARQECVSPICRFNTRNAPHSPLHDYDRPQIRMLRPTEPINQPPVHSNGGLESGRLFPFSHRAPTGTPDATLTLDCNYNTNYPNETE